LSIPARDSGGNLTQTPREGVSSAESRAQISALAKTRKVWFERGDGLYDDYAALGSRLRRVMPGLIVLAHSGV
jgi:hypothetical protein